MQFTTGHNAERAIQRTANVPAPLEAVGFVIANTTQRVYVFVVGEEVDKMHTFWLGLNILPYNLNEPPLAPPGPAAPPAPPGTPAAEVPPGTVPPATPLPEGLPLVPLTIPEIITSAARSMHTVIINYTDKKGVTTVREVEPYEFKDGYFWAHCLTRNQIRSFLMGGIGSATETTSIFSPRYSVLI